MSTRDGHSHSPITHIPDHWELLRLGGPDELHVVRLLSAAREWCGHPDYPIVITAVVQFPPGGPPPDLYEPWSLYSQFDADLQEALTTDLSAILVVVGTTHHDRMYHFYAKRDFDPRPHLDRLVRDYSELQVGGEVKWDENWDEVRALFGTEPERGDVS